MKTPSAIVIIHDGFEEVETIASIDLLRRAGVHVTLLTAGAQLLTEGRNGIRVECDALLEEYASEADMLIIPGGPSFEKLRKDERVLARIRSQHQRGEWIASICAGPVVLNAAGVLAGVRHTCHPTVATELPDREEAAVLRDGKLITSAGAGTALEFGLALVEALVGRKERADVAAAIVYKG